MQLQDATCVVHDGASASSPPAARPRPASRIPCSRRSSGAAAAAPAGAADGRTVTVRGISLRAWCYRDSTYHQGGAARRSMTQADEHRSAVSANPDKLSASCVEQTGSDDNACSGGGSIQACLTAATAVASTAVGLEPEPELSTSNAVDSPGAGCTSGEKTPMSTESRCQQNSLSCVPIPLSQYLDDKTHHFINKTFPGLRAIHKTPWIFEVDNFLSKAECAVLIKASAPHLCKAPVGDKSKEDSDGQVVDDEYRRCRTQQFDDLPIPAKTVDFLRKRITSLISCSESHLEVTQITKYSSGDFFAAHEDGFARCYRRHAEAQAPGQHSNRIATVIVYLNDVQHGGETRFTQTEPVIDVAPKLGKAVVFFPARLPSAATDPGGLAANVEHEALTVLAGEKWIAQQWVWSHPYKGYA